MTILTITKIGDSEGVILPKELLAKLGLSTEDRFYVTQIPDGLKLTVYTEEFAQQMDVAERIMNERRDALGKLPD